MRFLLRHPIYFVVFQDAEKLRCFAKHAIAIKTYALAVANMLRVARHREMTLCKA
jgi:hypothetical protein